MARDLSDGQTIAPTVPETAAAPGEFTNVTAMSWPGVHAHHRYAAELDYRRLKAALQDDLMRLSYEDLARVSWIVGSLLGSER